MAGFCKDVYDWVEENIEKSIESFEMRLEQSCREADCIWWLLCLNKLFCWVFLVIVKIVRVVVVTVGKWVLRVVCEVSLFLLNVWAFLVNLLLAIPILGPLVKAIIRGLTWAASYAVGLLDGLGRAMGIRIPKHLRVEVVPLCQGDVPLATEAHLAAVMREATRILYDQAQIRVHTTFHEPVRDPPEDALRFGTSVDLYLDESWMKGTWHQAQTLAMFNSNLVSLLAIGHPIVVYVILEVGYDPAGGPNKTGGASGGPFMDWVVVERDSVVDQVVQAPGGGPASPLEPYPPVSGAAAVGMTNPSYSRTMVAHELCHSLGLLGHANSSQGELMAPIKMRGEALSPFQVGIIRNSAHVTFL